MNNLEQLSVRFNELQSNLNEFKQDLERALIESEKKEEQKSVDKYELTDFMREIIQQTLDRFIDKHVFDQLDTSYQRNVYGGGIDIDITFDLQDIVSDELGSSHRLSNDFVDELIRELDYLKNEEDETTESGEQQHQDC